LKEETALRKGTERELWETRRKVKEEMKQLKRKGSEDEVRYHFIREELMDCEVKLKTKEKEFAKLQVRISRFKPRCSLTDLIKLSKMSLFRVVPL
jgi:phosphoenolpyruvate synthase/pyruvate phosphate dikinase